jgi:large subunit ribosomal protein L13
VPILTGKHKPNFTPGLDTGDNVIVINSENIHLSGRKWKGKLYRWHTGYRLKTKTALMMHENDQTSLVSKAVYGMLPHNFQRKRRMERLHIFKDDKHPFEAQKPILFEPLTNDAVYRELRF